MEFDCSLGLPSHFSHLAKTATALCPQGGLCGEAVFVFLFFQDFGNSEKETTELLGWSTGVFRVFTNYSGIKSRSSRSAAMLV